MAPGIVASTGYRLSDDDPRIVVAEDTGVLLVAFRIRRNVLLATGFKAFENVSWIS